MVWTSTVDMTKTVSPMGPDIDEVPGVEIF